jgi:hypothetical protein
MVAGNVPAPPASAESTRIQPATLFRRGYDSSAIRKLSLIAKERGGECLSTRYVDTKTPLQWRCAFGHTWRATLASIVGRETWCPDCIGNRRLALDDLQRIAHERGGRCLSRVYVNARTPLLWECRFGHRWKAAAGPVKGGVHRKGTWCPTCFEQRRRFRPKGNIEEMRRLAASRGGTCVSASYAGALVKLVWQCAERHRWYAVPGRIKRGSWCPACAGNQKLKIAVYRALAAQHGGQCISKKCKNSEAKLRWRCTHGHEWTAAGYSVRRGSWCPTCAHNRRRGTSRRRPGRLWSKGCGIGRHAFPDIRQKAVEDPNSHHRLIFEVKRSLCPIGLRPVMQPRSVP